MEILLPPRSTITRNCLFLKQNLVPAINYKYAIGTFLLRILQELVDTLQNKLHSYTNSSMMDTSFHSLDEYNSAIVSDVESEDEDDALDATEYYTAARTERHLTDATAWYTAAQSNTSVPAVVNTAARAHHPHTAVSSSLSTIPTSTTPTSSNIQSQYNPSAGERVRMVGGTYEGKMGTFVKFTPKMISVVVDGEPKSTCLKRYNVVFINNINNRPNPTNQHPAGIPPVQPASATAAGTTSDATALEAFEVGRAVEVIGGTYLGIYGKIQKVTPEKVAVMFDNDPNHVSHYLLKKNVQMMATPTNDSRKPRRFGTKGTRTPTPQGHPSPASVSPSTTRQQAQQPPQPNPECRHKYRISMSVSICA